MLELLLLYFILPTIIYFARFRINVFLVLWTALAYCLWILWRQGNLGVASLDLVGFKDQLPSLLSLFVPFLLITTVFVYRFSRRNLFALVRSNPGLWALIMVAYPVLSVYPQGVIYRAFFFLRYRDLFPNQLILLVASALAFAYLHIIFRNRLAVALTACGGLLFAARYAQTHSLFVSSFEHALYGCWIFTVGLGHSFLYRGPLSQATNKGLIFQKSAGKSV